MTFDVTTKDMAATACVKCHVRMWNMWNHNTMLQKGYPGRQNHSAFHVHWLKMPQEGKSGIKTIYSVQFSKKASKYKIFRLLNTAVQTRRFSRELQKVGIPQVKVILKLTKMTK